MAEKLKILIIEDNKPVRIVCDAGLSDSVFEKRFEENGTEALETYTTWQPDIIILDLMLPGMSGFSILQEIRQERKDTKTAVVVASSISEKDTVVDVLKLGVQGYILKPFTHKDIAVKVLESYKRMNPERAQAALASLESGKE
jgi:CheY-like chemotaxis protein